MRKVLSRLQEDDVVSDPDELVERLFEALPAGMARTKTSAKEKKKAATVRKAATAKTSRRRSGSEAKRLAVALELPLAEKTGWRIRIWLAKEKPNIWFGAMQKGVQVLLDIDEKHKPHWQVDVRGVKKGEYTSWAGEEGANSFRLPHLKRLEDFPSWLKKIEGPLRTRFSIADADISCGRYRSSIKLLRAWPMSVN